jgi:hypothetical protein
MKDLQDIAEELKVLANNSKIPIYTADAELTEILTREFEESRYNSIDNCANSHIFQFESNHQVI